MIGHSLGRTESSIKKFKPHRLYDAFFFQAVLIYNLRDAMSKRDAGLLEEAIDNATVR